MEVLGYCKPWLKSERALIVKLARSDYDTIQRLCSKLASMPSSEPATLRELLDFVEPYVSINEAGREISYRVDVAARKRVEELRILLLGVLMADYEVIEKALNEVADMIPKELDNDNSL